ncbi:hypothetical protein [Zymobacter palmae]|uniref:hypothetical protein n=1 Tax=Zymobacter palmae TaxID=33074 RepID=UPI000571F083|nr:hypothetical protein [Zymobacter palmae]
MYQDPRQVRSRRITVYLNELEDNVINAHAALHGIPKAQLVRQLAMKEADELLGLYDTQGRQHILG